MPFVKLVKNKAYFKRFQVKYRRRREGKTDYYARKRLVVQAKNKYNTPKYRFVVRFTNSDIVCQIVYAQIQGDMIMASAYSHELSRYGVKVGLTNYAAAYCTGLLCARRVLTKLKLDSKYEGKANVDGELFIVQENNEGPSPFKAFLDVGLKRTTTGSRVFAAMKGAADGGVFIPHSERRFAGYDNEGKKLDASVLRKYIYGGHVADYMKTLESEDEDHFKRQFAEYISAGISADTLESIYAKAHELIRKDPMPQKKEEKDVKTAEKSKQFKVPRLTSAQRKEKVAQKISEFKNNLAMEED